MRPLLTIPPHCTWVLHVLQIYAEPVLLIKLRECFIFLCIRQQSVFNQRDGDLALITRDMTNCGWSILYQDSSNCTARVCGRFTLSRWQCSSRCEFNSPPCIFCVCVTSTFFPGSSLFMTITALDFTFGHCQICHVTSLRVMQCTGYQFPRSRMRAYAVGVVFYRNPRHILQQFGSGTWD